MSKLIVPIVILAAFLHLAYHVASSPGSRLRFEEVRVPTPDPPSLANINFRIELPERGVLSATSTGVSGAVESGYAQIVADPGTGAASGLALFSKRQNGILLGEAGVPGCPPIRSGRIHVDMNSPVTTGLAVANPNDRPVTLSFYFTDSNGRDFNRGATTIPPNGQIAPFLNETPFSAGASFRGTLTFSTDLDVAAIGLRGHTNERRDFLVTTLPLVDATARSAGTLLFPHFAVGGGWSTELLLVNPADIPVTGIVSFVSEGEAAAGVDYSIPSRSSRVIRPRAATRVVRTGFVRVIAAAGSPPPDGVVLLAFERDGITVSEAGLGSVRPNPAFSVYAQSSESVQTGIAIANPSTASITVNLDLISASGAARGTGLLHIEAGGQVAAFVHQIEGLSLPRSWEGLIRVSTMSRDGVVVTGLIGHTNERSDFLITSAPAVPETTLPSATKLLFPYLVDGGGHSTRFVLFNARAGSALAGTLSFYKPSGQRLELALR